MLRDGHNLNNITIDITLVGRKINRQSDLFMRILVFSFLRVLEQC